MFDYLILTYGIIICCIIIYLDSEDKENEN